MAEESLSTIGDVLNYFVKTRKLKHKNKTFIEKMKICFPELNETPLSTLVSKMEKLKKWKESQQKNKKIHLYEEFLKSKFKPSGNIVIPTNVQNTPTATAFADQNLPSAPKRARKNFDLNVLKAVNTDVIKENVKMEAKIENLTLKNEELTAKIKEFNPKKVNQNIKRKKTLITKYKLLAKSQKNQKKLCNCKYQVDCLKKKCKVLQKKNKVLVDINKVLKIHENAAVESYAENEKLKKEIDHYKNRVQKLEYETYIHDNEKVITKNKIYSDEVRRCCYFLLSNGVGIDHVGEIINYIVVNLCKREIDELPKKSEVAVMLRELGVLSKIQVGEKLMSTKNYTLHTDGTSKKGHHFSGVQISTEDRKMSLGMEEIPSGTSENYFKSVITEIKDCARMANAASSNQDDSFYEKAVVNCKNTMTDKHIVEAKMVDMIEQERKQLLEKTVEGWDQLTIGEREQMGQINRFTCGLHALANMAQSAEETIKIWEKKNSVASINWAHRGSSATQSHIKAVCNLFHKDGGGCPGEIQIFLTQSGFKKCPIEPFSGSRFNILFHNGAGVYACKHIISDFINQIVQTKNKLHTAIMADMSSDEIYTACRALGLIDKLITAPFWRRLEEKDASGCKKSALYTAALYTDVFQTFEKLSSDSSTLLQGINIFGETVQTNDKILSFLLQNVENDMMCQSLLQDIITGNFIKKQDILVLVRQYKIFHQCFCGLNCLMPEM